MAGLGVRGFRGAAVAAGIKYENRLDLGLIVSDVPAVSAAVFTRNVVKAAPVLEGMRHMNGSDSRISAIVVNSGNANACTGKRGVEDYRTVCGSVASVLGIPAGEVVFSSTGVIGAPLPVERFEKAIPGLVKGLSETGLDAVAQAILTTDTCPKTAVRRATIDGIEITLAGMAKGAGMIAPSMGPPQATMLAFIMSDAAVEQAWWQEALERAVETSFNRITVDGDTSTNDTVYALANGMAGNTPLKEGSTGADTLEALLHELLLELAVQIVRDGEGATKCVAIHVKGAGDDASALAVARTVADSPLVKTALAGEDPNWGRILAAAGRSGVSFDPEKVNLWIGDVQIAASGMGTGAGQEAAASGVMKQREFSIVLDLGCGAGSTTVYTCDLTDEYVHINADYRT